MKFLSVLTALLLFVPLLQAQASQRAPITQRTSALTQRPMKEASTETASHAWKLTLLGLAAVSFLIRKRL